MSDANKLYSQLAQKLGDIEAKIHMLQQQKNSLLKTIENLDQFANLLPKEPHGAKEKTPKT